MSIITGKGGDSTRKNANLCALTLLEEIRCAPNLHHALLAKDALFHVRLLAKSVAREMDETWIANGLGQVENKE